MLGTCKGNSLVSIAQLWHSKTHSFPHHEHPFCISRSWKSNVSKHSAVLRRRFFFRISLGQLSQLLVFFFPRPFSPFARSFWSRDLHCNQPRRVVGTLPYIIHIWVQYKYRYPVAWSSGDLFCRLLDARHCTEEFVRNGARKFHWPR